MEVLENRDQWLAAFQAGWLAHYQETGEIDWGRYNRLRNTTPIRGRGIDLSKSRLMLVSSAGSHLGQGQEPFDADNPLGDYGIRAFPTSTPFEALAFAHTHYDHAAVDADPQVLLPLRHLEHVVAEGTIGELAPSVASFMGYQPDVSRVVDETAAAILEVAQSEQVDAALLVPA